MAVAIREIPVVLHLTLKAALHLLLINGEIGKLGTLSNWFENEWQLLDQLRWNFQAGKRRLSHYSCWDKCWNMHCTNENNIFLREIPLGECWSTVWRIKKGGFVKKRMLQSDASYSSIMTWKRWIWKLFLARIRINYARHDYNYIWYIYCEKWDYNLYAK